MFIIGTRLLFLIAVSFQPEIFKLIYVVMNSPALAVLIQAFSKMVKCGHVTAFHHFYINRKCLHFSMINEKRSAFASFSSWTELCVYNTVNAVTTYITLKWTNLSIHMKVTTQFCGNGLVNYIYIYTLLCLNYHFI